MILILGGTTEAHVLASAIEQPFVVSLAGATRAPKSRDYPVRIGGFGGAGGLVDYMRANDVTAVIDATHPFAARISQNAVIAARMTATPLLRFERPVWPLQSGWRIAADIETAAETLPAGARVFLSIGSRHLEPFARRRDIWCLTRAIEHPVAAPAGEILLQRPPFTVTGETALMQRYHITHLVSKNAGGQQTSAKLDAARALGIEVLMVERPELPLAETVHTLKDARQWIRHQAEL